MSHLIPYRPNMLGGIPNPFSRMGNYFSRPRSQLGGHRGLPRHLSYDTCYDCEITAGQHVCQSCLASQYGYEHYSCACSLCDFCDDGYGGGYSNMGGRGGGYGGGLYYDPRMYAFSLSHLQIRPSVVVALLLV